MPKTKGEKGDGGVPSPVAVIAKGEKAAKSEEKGRKLTWEDVMDFQLRPSQLSVKHNNNDYKGFVNVCIILMVIGNLRIIIQNLYKYGILVDMTMISKPAEWPLFSLIAGQSVHYMIAYGVENLACGPLYKLPLLARTLHFMNALAAFLVSWAGIYLLSVNAGASIIILLFSTVAMMKIFSFAHVSEMRRTMAAEKDHKATAPTVSQLCYFMGAPTLVYSPVYPRNPKIRWFWLSKRILEFLAIWLGIYVIAQQYVAPGIKNTLDPLARGNLPMIVEGLLKISVPNFIVWILGFYSIFHLYLNIIAEFMKYGDRQFYKDWWNSTTLGFFWRSWNLPVHSWMVAHVYFPLVSRGWRKPEASLVIFIISALMHELIVSIPFGNFKLLAFGGMMMQVPLIQLTDRFKGTQTGNVIFWLTIMLGQPMIVLLYARDYMKGLSGPWTDADTKTWAKIVEPVASIFGAS
mmetsp:Transcript_5660/g.14348  ORF Transcript_5660/g.14348 Transcript_5660/m.14348 type:complete len:462 (-) Transcript_5660:55-1440(-)